MSKTLKRVGTWPCWGLLAIVLPTAIVASLHHEYDRASWNLLVAVLLFRELVPVPVRIGLTFRGLPDGTTVTKADSEDARDGA